MCAVVAAVSIRAEETSKQGPTKQKMYHTAIRLTQLYAAYTDIMKMAECSSFTQEMLAWNRNST